jgi:tetratricopeptide (TPR) repeat protein
MRASLRIARPLCAFVVVLLLGGCDRIYRSLYLSGYDRDIKESTRAIETARDDARRAAGYTQRGRAYSEKARYCRTFKLIPAGEYDRLFGLAVKDHDHAVALNPGSAEAHFSRGQTHYDRAALEAGEDARKLWFDPAAADFKKAIERDGRHYMAWDMLGLVHEQTGELDKAISAFTQEMALNPLGRVRLADAHCVRGSSYHKEKKYVAAIADYEKAIEIGAADDGCSCDPYNPLVALYGDVSRQYDKGWRVVHKARKSKRWIAPELLEKLKKDSGRDDSSSRQPAVHSHATRHRVSE